MWMNISIHMAFFFFVPAPKVHNHFKQINESLEHE